MAALASLFPESRVIACVRDPVKIINSFERLIRKNALLVSRMFPAEANATVFTRVDHLTAKHGTVGFAWNALQEAFYGEFSNRLILVDYEALARDPKRTLSKLYDLLNFLSTRTILKMSRTMGGRIRPLARAPWSAYDRPEGSIYRDQISSSARDYSALCQSTILE